MCNWNFLQLRGWLYVHCATCANCNLYWKVTRGNFSNAKRNKGLQKPCLSIFLQAYERMILDNDVFLSQIYTSKIIEKAKQNNDSNFNKNTPNNLPPFQKSKPPPPIHSEINKCTPNGPGTSTIGPNQVKENIINTIQCPICQCILESDDALFKHAAQCREKAPFSCKHCDLRFSHRVLYKTHMRDAHDEFRVKFRL